MVKKNIKIPSKAMQKRITESGEVTDDDIKEYAKQVGEEALSGIPQYKENVREYLKNFTELGNPKQKKKLPSKKKIDSTDSILVVDSSDRVAKVSSDDASLTTQSRAKRATEGLIGLGTNAFNKMFPTLGRFMTYIQATFGKQDKKSRDTDESVEGYSRQVGKSSVLLINIIEGQERTNKILQQILSVVGSRNMSSAEPNRPPNQENAERTNRNQTGANPRSPGPAGGVADPTINPIAAAAALAATGAAGAVIGSSLNAPAANAPAANAPAANAPAANAPAAPAPVAPAAPPVAARATSITVVRNPPTPTTVSNIPQSVTSLTPPRVSAEQPNVSDIRLLNFKAKEIVFKTEKFEYPEGFISSAMATASGSAATISSGSGSSTSPSVSSGGSMTASGSQTSAPELSTLRTKSGKTVQVATSVAGRFQGFLNELESTGYQIREIGGYANRANVNNPSVMSTHAAGLSIDINPAQNPNRSRTTDMPPETAQIAAKYGLGWGMNWRTVQDPMHFSAAANEGGGTPSPTTATSMSSAAPAGIANDGAPAAGTGATASMQQPGNAPSVPAASPAPSIPSSGAAISRASTADEASSRPSAVSVMTTETSPTAVISNAPQQPSSTSIDPNNPGDVEPPDAALRYSRLFNMAA